MKTTISKRLYLPLQSFHCPRLPANLGCHAITKTNLMYCAPTLTTRSSLKEGIGRVFLLTVSSTCQSTLRLKFPAKKRRPSTGRLTISKDSHLPRTLKAWSLSANLPHKKLKAAVGILVVIQMVETTRGHHEQAFRSGRS